MMLRWYRSLSLDRRTVTSAGGADFSARGSFPYDANLSVFPSTTEASVFIDSNISAGTRGGGGSMFHLPLTSNRPVFVFFHPLPCSHNMKLNRPFKSASQYAVSNILFTAYGLYIRMC